MSPMMMKIAGLCVLVAVVSSAPFSKLSIPSRQENKRPDEAPVEEVSHQDKDLQDLLQLINSQANQKNVVVHKEKMSHFENNNGRTLKINEEEEKVMDKQTGKVLADVKQEIKQQSPDAQNEPETIVETKVDIPEENIHKKFLQDSESAPSEPEQPSEELPVLQDEEAAPEGSAEVSPTDMAEYLYYTQQFDAFFSGLDKLVNESKLSANDAAGYARAVAGEYQRIQAEEQAFFSETQAYPDVPASYPDVPATYPGVPAAYPGVPAQNPGVPTKYSGVPAYQRPSYDFPQAAYSGVPAAYPGVPAAYPGVPSYERPAYGYAQAAYPREQRKAMYLGVTDIDPYEFLAALWAEAYGNGNPEAKEIVQILYDRVSHDDNPDDMGQIRDILMETAASSLNDLPLASISQPTQDQEVPAIVNDDPATDPATTESKVSKEYKLANLEKVALEDEDTTNAEAEAAEAAEAEAEGNETGEESNAQNDSSKSEQQPIEPSATTLSPQ